VSEVFPAFELTSYSVLAKNQALQVQLIDALTFICLSFADCTTLSAQVMRALGSSLTTSPADAADARSPNQELADRDQEQHSQRHRHRTHVRSPADKAILTDIMYKLLSDREVGAYCYLLICCAAECPRVTRWYSASPFDHPISLTVWFHC
jgi:hypothetical protein